MRGFRIASRHPDPFASLLAFGLTAVLILSAVVNIGVVLGMLPTKGLPLPFLSYGGSAMVANLAALGVLVAINNQPTQGSAPGIPRSLRLVGSVSLARDADNEFMMLDATIVRAHQHSAGAQKKAAKTKPSAARAAA